MNQVSRSSKNDKPRIIRNTFFSFPLPAKILTAALGALLFACVMPAGARAASTGFNAITDFDGLQFLRSGESIHQVSSYDKTGGNTDGGRNEYGLTSYLYLKNGEYTLVDEKGAGCVYRMWFTKLPAGNIRFYFDGETTPRIDMPATSFFSGLVEPFVYPLVANADSSSGGFVSYYPFGYKKSIRIATTTMPFYYGITYKRYTNAEQVTTFTGGENKQPAIDLLNSRGQQVVESPEFITQTESFSLAPNAAKTIHLDGPGTVYALRFSKATPQANFDFTTFSDNLWLEMTWDNHVDPDVESNFSLFFGGGIEYFAARSLPVGSDSSTQSYYCYFPMPFAENADITITNSGPASTGLLNCEIEYKPSTAGKPGKDVGYFRANYASGLTKQDQDWILLETSGTGHIVGVVMDMNGGMRPRYLEGDERVYIDGSATPQLYGTGTEDFFNGGWYFDRGRFTLPYHGKTYGELYVDTRFICYRFMLAEPINYYSGVKFGMEHGDINNEYASYKTLAFYYESEYPSVYLTDSVELGEPASENAHNYSNGAGSAAAYKGGSYDGDADDVSIGDNGYNIVQSSEFRVQINLQNNGVRLRRRLDYSLQNQQAQVYVDGQLAGTWYDPGMNTSKRWRDSDFEIPALYTAGKNAVTVKIEVANGQNWSEYKYWVFSHQQILAPEMALDIDNLALRLPKGQVAERFISVSNQGEDNLFVDFRIPQQTVQKSVLFTGWGDAATTQPYWDDFIKYMTDHNWQVTNMPNSPADFSPYDMVILLADKFKKGYVNETALIQYVESGGNLMIFESTLMFGVLSPKSVLAPYTSSSLNWQYRQGAKKTAAHYITSTLPETFNFVGYAANGDLKSNQNILMTWNDGAPFLTEAHYGAGAILYVNHVNAWNGALWYNDMTNGQLLMTRMLEYLADAMNFDWYAVAPQTATIEPLTSQTFTVSFDAMDAALAPGIYRDNLELLSNDQAKNFTSIPVQVTVGAPFTRSVAAGFSGAMAFGETDLSLQFVTVPKTENVTAVSYEVLPENSDPDSVLARVWQVQTATTVRYYPIVHYNETDISRLLVPELNLRVGYWVENKWIGLPTEIDAQNNTAKAIVLFNGNCDLALGVFADNSDTVPVELSGFTATAVDSNNSVILRWTTESEQNNLGFEIQRATSGDFSPVGWVNGAGTSSEPHQYRFVDVNVPQGQAHYRLKQIDTDGAYNFSATKTVTLLAAIEFALKQNYPNPFNSSTVLTYSLPRAELATILVFDILGRHIATLHDGLAQAGPHTAKWDGRDRFGRFVPSGVYLIQLQTRDDRRMIKVVFSR